MKEIEILTKKPTLKGSKCICTAPTLDELAAQINAYYCSENYVIMGNFAYNTHTQDFADGYFVHRTKTFYQYRRAAVDFTVEIAAEEEFSGSLFDEPETAENAEPTAFEQRFYDRADRKEKRAVKTAAAATAKAESGWAMLDVIPMGQPVHGAKDRRYRDRAGAKIDGGYAMMQKSENQVEKAEASRKYAEKVQSGAITRSDDPEAIQKLQKRIAELEKQHEEAKNAVKRHNAEFARMLKNGEFEVKTLDPWGNPLKDDASEYAKSHAHTAYYKDGERWEKWSVEQSTTAEIRRLKSRIDDIRKTAKVCENLDGWDFDGGHIVLNAENGRIQAFFNEIPSDEIRTVLKHDGWHWSKNAGAWQKMLNAWNIKRTKNSEIFKPIAEKPEQIPGKSAQPETPPTDAPENKPVKKTVKKSKKPEVKRLTPEEMAAKLENLKRSDDWKISALLMLTGNRNPEIIMSAGISAGVITYDDFADYMTSGRMPQYHTYAEWVKMGRQVKQGEKSRFKAHIWKYTEKKGEMTAEQAESLNAMMLNAGGKKYQAGDETTESRFVKKEAFFFGVDQTEKAGEIQRFEVGKQYETRAGVITVTGRAESTLTYTANGKTYTKNIQQGKKAEFVKVNRAGLTAQATAAVQQMQNVPDAKPEEPEETAKPERPESVKFVQGRVYWRKYQILNKSAKMLTIKNILTGEIFKKKIQVSEATDRTPETEYVKFSSYEKLFATAPNDTYENAVYAGLAVYQESAPRHRKEADSAPFNGYKMQNAEESEKLLATYQKLAAELKKQAA